MGEGIKDDVMNAYCWMYSTFSIPRKFSGVCSKHGVDPKTHLYNTYYQVWSVPQRCRSSQLNVSLFQWVPIFLAMSAAIFCLPRLAWLMSEGGLMSFLAKGATGKCVENSLEKRDLLLDAFTQHLKNRYTNYALTFFVCEQLNSVTLFCVWYMTDSFLQNQARTQAVLFVSMFPLMHEKRPITD